MKTLISIMNHAVKPVVIALAPLAAVNSALAADWFVDANITTPGTGSVSWSNAFKYLRNALENPLLANGDTIRIKGATGGGLVYYPDLYWNGTTTVNTDNPADSFIIDGLYPIAGGNIRVLGQHTGTSTTARDPAYRTILSGAISGSERSLHVLRIDGVTGGFNGTQLDGLEIADGAADATGTGDNARGGGILLGATDAASPLIRACTIRDNLAAYFGGGAFFRNGSPTLRKTSFTNNTAQSEVQGAGGGGLVMEPTVSDPPNDLLMLAVRFEGNLATGPSEGRAGGAWIYERTRRVDIIDSAFVNNVIEADDGITAGGGGLVLRFAPECELYEECPGGTDGVLSCEPCPPPCDHEDVTYATVINTIFVGNETRGGNGGGLRISRPTSFINSTIAGNLSDNVTLGGAGVYLAHQTCAEFFNTIVYGNVVSGSSSLSPFEKQIFHTNDLTFERCDVEGISGESYEICGSTPTSTCNIDADPKFVDAANGNYRLSAGSPCRNMGVDAHMPDDTNDVDEDSDDDEPTPDLDFWTRIYGTSVDMGAYEFRCLGDLDCDCDVDGFDQALLLGQWSGSSTYSPCPPYRSGDLNSDCKVDGNDLARLLNSWGTCATGCVAETSGCPTGGGGGESLMEGGGESSEESSGSPSSPTLAEMVEYFMENGHEDLVPLLIATWPLEE